MFHILRCNKQTITEWETTKSRPFWRIYWNQTSGALVRSKFEQVYPDTASLICIPPTLRVEQILLRPFEHLWFHVDTPFLIDYELKIHKVEVEQTLKNRLELLVGLLERGQGNSSQAQNLKQLVVHWFMSGLLLEDSSITRDVSELVRKAVEIMDERLQSGISTGELASLLSVSSKTLNRQFNKYLGFPPHKFLTNLRIKKASALLFTNELSLDEISYECGFCNRSHFSRAFRDRYNQSPASFRREQNN